jgi:hypothetical protein
MKAIKTLVLISTLCPAWAVAAEDPFSGAKPLLCAAAKVLVCSETAVCAEGTPEEADLPRFVTVDVSNKQVSGAWPPGMEKVSTIGSMQSLSDRLIIQGVDTDVPWSATLDKETGKLVATQSRKYVSFTVFGACMPR